MWRTIRILLSALCFFGFLLLFLDLSGSVSPHVAFLGKIQLVPALLSGSAVTLLALLLCTLLLGRVYCSVLCPLGIMQDIISRCASLPAKRHGKRHSEQHRFRHRAGRPFLRGAVLLLFAAALLAGAPLVYSLLDPYSAFGRVATTLLHPLATLGNNALALAAHSLDSFAVAPAPVVQKGLSALLGAVLTLGLVGWLAWRGGRTWCNTLCPVGTALGLVSRFALLRPRIVAEKCVHCGLCAARCKASCIDTDTATVDASRCVACFNCQDVCRHHALTFRPTRHAQEVSAAPAVGMPSLSRRSLLTALAATAIALPAEAARRGEDAAIPALTRKQRSVRAVPVLPPGATGLRRFTARCTGCQLCVSACTHQVLRASDTSAGMLQPVMTFEHGFCRVNCVACTAVCPTTALRPLTVEEKSVTQVGRAVVQPELCIVNTDKVRCTACARNCPPEAIRLVGEGEHKLPAVDTERCTGCGACEYVCPARPHAAIRVEGNLEHRRI